MARHYLDLACTAARHPGRALLRLVKLARLKRTELDEDRARLLHLVSLAWGVDGPALLAEYRRSSFTHWYQERARPLRQTLGTARWSISDDFSLEAVYLFVRAARPKVVIETGVLYGAASGHILAALETNGAGELHSIDLGVGPGEPGHDTLVPPEFAHRWRYHVGDVRDVLPPLLYALGTIDFFHHDSLHTFDHMTWEYRQAMTALSSQGVLSSHDILVADGLRGVFRENAFPRFCREEELPHFMVRNLGVALRRATVPAGRAGRTAPAAGERQPRAALTRGPVGAAFGTIGALSVG